MQSPDSVLVLIHVISSLFNDSTYADLAVTCGDREWQVHKAIVCTRSSWFANAIKHETVVSAGRSFAL